MPETPPQPDPSTRRFDWRTWLALGWALWFGVLYGRMVLHERAPGVSRSIARAVEALRTSYK